MRFLFAQNADSTHLVIPSDSIIVTTGINSDSLKIDSLKIARERESNIAFDKIWVNFQIDGNIDTQPQQEIYFEYDDIITTNYTGLADVFRNVPEFQIYDFYTMGYPRYISRNNLLPHQSSISLNGYGLTDPIHGMLNTHLISLDGLLKINDQTGLPTYGYGEGINLKSKAINSLEEPYSRIMFRQGDFGYTDLDIDFSRTLSDNFSINVGGINKIYHGDNNYGFQYRAGLYYRFSRKILSRTDINIDREKIININYSQFPQYRYREFRHDISSSVYYVTDFGDVDYWKIDIGYTRIRRKNDAQGDSASTFLNRGRVDKYSIRLNRDLQLDSLDIGSSLLAYQNKIWGSSFSEKFTDTGVSGLVQFNYPITKWLQIDGNLKIGYLNGEDINWSPGMAFRFDFAPVWMKLSGSRSQRFAYRNERSINYNQYSGNSDLNSESLETYSAKIGFTPFNNLDLSAKIATNKISNEILFDSTNFYNGPKRRFDYFGMNGKYSLYKFTLEVSGHINNANINISPKKSFSWKLHYHDTWLKGVLIIDAVGSFHWYDIHNSVYYNPIVERLYWTNSEIDRFSYFSYKIMATVKSAQLYVAMDNPMAYEYEYISGYYEFYRRVRFGVNWVLMD